MVATNRDFKSWYRMTPVARRDIWASGIVLDGEFYSDERMVMGAVPSAHTGHRISALVCLYLLARFDYEWHVIAKLLPRKLLLRISEMQEGRVAVYGHLVEQLRPFGLVGLQDDQTHVAMGRSWVTSSSASFTLRLKANLE